MITGDWHDEALPLDLEDREPAIILERASVLEKSTASNDFQDRNVCYGLLVTYHKSEVGRETLRVQTYKHLEFVVLSVKESRVLTRIKHCWDEVLAQHHDELKEAMTNGGNTAERIRGWIDISVRSSGLLQLAKEVQRYRSLDASDNATIVYCAVMANFLGHLGQYTSVRETNTSIEWYVD